MKAMIVALTFALALTANANLLKRAEIGTPDLSLVQIKNHPLGQSILSVAQLHMKVGDSFAELDRLLKEIFDDLQAQDILNEQTHTEDVAYCESETAKFEGVIYDQAHIFNENNKTRAANEANLADLRPKLKSIQAELERDRQDLEDRTNTRNQRHETYLRDIENNRDAIEATKEALGLLRSLIAGQTFIQLKGRFAKVQERLEATKPDSHAHVYGPIIRSLAQITTKADPEAIKRIIGLIEKLNQDLLTASQTIQTDEETQVTAYTQAKAQLEKEIQDGEKAEKETSILIKQNEESLAEALENMEVSQKRLETAGANLKALKDDCERREQKYQANKAQLAEELRIVKALIDHFAQKSPEIQKFISEAPENEATATF